MSIVKQRLAIIFNKPFLFVKRIRFRSPPNIPAQSLDSSSSKIQHISRTVGQFLPFLVENRSPDLKVSLDSQSFSLILFLDFAGSFFAPVSFVAVRSLLFAHQFLFRAFLSPCAIPILFRLKAIGRCFYPGLSAIFLCSLFSLSPRFEYRRAASCFSCSVFYPPRYLYDSMFLFSLFFVYTSLFAFPLYECIFRIYSHSFIVFSSALFNTPCSLFNYNAPNFRDLFHSSRKLLIRGIAVQRISFNYKIALFDRTG